MLRKASSAREHIDVEKLTRDRWQQEQEDERLAQQTQQVARNTVGYLGKDYIRGQGLNG
jgi:hypothetical protein